MEKYSLTTSQNVTLHCRLLVIQHRQASSSILPHKAKVSWFELLSEGEIRSERLWPQSDGRCWLFLHNLSNSQKFSQKGWVLLFFFFFGCYFYPSLLLSIYRWFQLLPDLQNVWYESCGTCTRTTGMQGKLLSGLSMTLFKGVVTFFFVVFSKTGMTSTSRCFRLS